jgi:hAT family C-terminal dimerisation region
VETIAPTTHRTVLSNWKYKENAKANRDFDELKEYFKLPLEDEDVSPQQWRVTNQYKFPILSAMARDFLSIPAMSAEVERVFSCYGEVRAGYGRAREDTDPKEEQECKN